MTLIEFIVKYDFENSIVLLEGKRKVIEEDKSKLVELGRLLTSRTKHMIFRSGNAQGADKYFSEGVQAIDLKRLQVITPYSSHRQKKNMAYKTISLEEIDLATEPEIVYQSKGNKQMERLVDNFVAGEINRNTIKAAYILRDTVKVLGTEEIGPATFGIFYDDLAKPNQGGTGHTMKVCEQNNVPFINQNMWFQWIGT